MTEALELRPSLSDGDLAVAAAGGDRQAFAEIYDRYADRLYDFCVGLLGDRDAAADCVQDAFCVAATDLGGLREPDKLRPWLYSIARHHAMRRLRHRYREEVSDEVPDMVSTEASPETLAGHSELARLVADAAGGLSDRDRELLDLSYRHGLDGPELAEALGVTLTSANTMMFRLRQTVERCLGALLVARGARANPQSCHELAAILKGWDGQFTVLMRKRMARHIDSCDTCEQERRRHVNPVALLGGAPVFIPAPAWLRRQTLDRVQLTSASSSMGDTPGDPGHPGHPGEPRQIARAGGQPSGAQRIGKRIAVVGIPLLCLGLSVSWFARQQEPVPSVVEVGLDSDGGPIRMAPGAVMGAPSPERPRSAGPAGPVQPPLPTGQVEPSPGVGAPTSIPEVPLANSGPALAPHDPPVNSVPIPNPIPSDTTTDGPTDTADTGTVPNPKNTATDPQTGTAGTASIPNPRGAGTDPGAGTGIVTNPPGTAPDPKPNTAPITNPNLNPKVVSPYPQTNTAIVTNPKTATPNLQINTANPQINNPQINTAPKPGTNPNTNTKPNTNTNPKNTTSGS